MALYQNIHTKKVVSMADLNHLPMPDRTWFEPYTPIEVKIPAVILEKEAEKTITEEVKPEPNKRGRAKQK